MKDGDFELEGWKNYFFFKYYLYENIYWIIRNNSFNSRIKWIIWNSIWQCQFQVKKNAMPVTQFSKLKFEWKQGRSDFSNILMIFFLTIKSIPTKVTAATTM